MDDVDIDKIIVSNKFSCKNACKYFIGHKGNEQFIPLCIMLQQITGWTNTHNTNFNGNRKSEEGSQCIYLSAILVDFLFKNDEN